MRFNFLFCSTGLLATALSMPSNPTPSWRDPKVGYLLTTFPVEDEQIYMYLSKGNNPHSWNQLTRNGTNTPILRTTVGSKGVRDSFVIPAVDGSKCWLIATDLSVNAFKEDFNEATRFGSRSIVVWESSNLVNWSEPRLTAPIVGVQAGNAWAPEAYWDEELSAYIVIFASRYWPVEDVEREGPQPPNQLMYVTTTDFSTFSKEKVFFFPGYPVIDATILPAPQEGPRVFYRWVKDERDYLIYQERSETGILGTWCRVGGAPDGERIEFAAQYNNNEGPLVFRDNVDPGLYHLWIDENDKQTYIPSTARTLNDMQAWKAEPLAGFPNKIKHGHVTAVNQEQYDALKAEYISIPASEH